MYDSHTVVLTHRPLWSGSWCMLYVQNPCRSTHELLHAMRPMSNVYRAAYCRGECACIVIIINLHTVNGQTHREKAMHQCISLFRSLGLHHAPGAQNCTVYAACAQAVALHLVHAF